MQKQGFIKYFIVIGVLLTAVFLSQRVDLFEKKQTFSFTSGAVSQAQTYLGDGSKWLTDKIYPNVSSEAQKRGAMVVSGVNEQKEKVSESITKKIKNYFSGISDSILHPGELNKDNCSCSN